MIIVKLQGGLGNQMFQYAAGKALARKHDTVLKADLSFLQDRSIKNIVFRDFDLDVFPNVHVPIATPEESLRLKKPFKLDVLNWLIRRSVGIKTHFVERSFEYQAEFEFLQSDVYLDGYWQSERYFLSIEDEVRLDFAFSNLKVLDNVEIKRQIHSTSSICLHVRRGDFITLASNSHGFVGLSYYQNAIDLIKRDVTDPHYFVFSDDIPWCRQHLDPGGPTTFVEHSPEDRKVADYLQLMSSCKNFIIPNSSFSWWAAWLNNEPAKIVISPAKYFADSSLNSADITPPSWIRI